MKRKRRYRLAGNVPEPDPLAEHVVLTGDCLDVLRSFPSSSVDAVVTDPPYGLSQEPDIVEVLMHWLNGDDYTHKGGGFMGKAWDSFVPGPSVWREVYRVLKPGGHVLSFSGTRTYGLTEIAIRLAGFEIRDQLAWLYGQGFPKSLDISKAIDKAAGAERKVVGQGGSTCPDIARGQPCACGERYGDERSQSGRTVHAPETAPATDAAKQWDGWGTGLKPAQEPIVLARKPLRGTIAENVQRRGTGALNIDACRVGDQVMTEGRATPSGTGCYAWNVEKSERPQLPDEPVTHVGRWPANVVFDEAAAALLDAQTSELKGGTAVRRNVGHSGKHGASFGVSGSRDAEMTDDVTYGDSGGASRFFYVAKASKTEREVGLEAFAAVAPTEITGRKPDSAGQNNPRAGMTGSADRRNVHPTVKPIALMRWLVRMVTPPNGLVLDPYTGSGTTGIAAKVEGFKFIGIELNEDYAKIARARIEAAK